MLAAGALCSAVPYARREAARQRLARDLDATLLERIANEVSPDFAIHVAAELMEGKVTGRVVVRIVPESAARQRPVS